MMVAAAYYPANKRYNEKNLVKITVAFNRKTEPELAAWVETKENRAGYLKQLVQEDIERTKQK
jgi:hypothetical protein